jgi:hypothetical protein
MPTTTQAPRDTTSDQSKPLPMPVRKLIASGYGGKLRMHEEATWQLDHSRRVQSSPAEARDTDDDSSDDDYDPFNDDNDSVQSEGSSITVLGDESDVVSTTTSTPVSSVFPSAIVSPVPPALGPVCLPALHETPPDKRAKMRKKAEDCHVLIRWSALKLLLKEHMACVKCGTAITRPIMSSNSPRRTNSSVENVESIVTS